jgi:hypothetical protein
LAVAKLLEGGGQADADPSQSWAADELFSNINMFSLRSAQSMSACPVEWWLWGQDRQLSACVYDCYEMSNAVPCSMWHL